MSWATKRRLFILGIVGCVVAAFLAVILFSTFYKAPSCTDGAKNQGETGIDCGGPCPYLCSADEQPPTVLFTQVLQNDGRTDVVASIENKNINAAAHNVPFRIALYGADHSSVSIVTGTLDLPPAGTVPVFLPGVMTGSVVITSAFLTIDPDSVRWFSKSVDAGTVPVVSNLRQTGTDYAPRIEAILTNSTPQAMNDVTTIVLVKDEQGSIIAASQTIVPVIPALGQATAIFTWNNPFTATSSQIDVVPIIPQME